MCTVCRGAVLSENECALHLTSCMLLVIRPSTSICVYYFLIILNNFLPAGTNPNDVKRDVQQHTECTTAP